MAEAQKEGRAQSLATQALELVASGQDEAGLRALREAASLSPNNSQVKEAFLKLQNNNLELTLQRLCSKFVLNDDEDAGKEALRYLSRSEVSGTVATECMELVAKPRSLKNQQLQDDILSGLLRESSAAKAFLAKRLYQCATDLVFEEIYSIGNGAADGIATVVLDPSAWSWSSDDARDRCEKDMFQLFLAQLLRVGDEHNDKALKGVARLLTADAEKLHGFVDEMCFDAVLACLDDRNPVEVRSQATLATAKYLEVSDIGQKTLVHFVASRIARQYNEDLVLAFSAAAGVFLVAPSIASALFLTEGFLESLIPLVEKKARSEKVEQATLNMLNAACVDTGCREAIGKYCTPWLQRTLNTRKDKRPGIAAVILAKCHGFSTQPSDIKGQRTGEGDGLVSKLKAMMEDTSAEIAQSSVEGLAYASVKPKVKDRLAKDKSFLQNFLEILSKSSAPGSHIAFGGLTLINNLTCYLPRISEEQKRITQLKAYANASKPSAQADPLDEEAAVSERCKAVVNAGVVPVLVGISKHLSPASISIAFNILFSLSKTPSLRGIIAQQGGIKLLLQSYTSIKGSPPQEVQSRRTAAHALARVLISVDPTLVFLSSGVISLTSAIQPLVSLLTEDPALFTEGPRDLLPTFEALLALTNLASAPSNDAAEMIVRLAWPIVEDLLLSNNVHVQCAATELVCNLVQWPAGIELYADDSQAAPRRMHILLAMADVEEKATRQAAGGALASVTQFDGAVKAILARDRGVEILLGLCEGEEGDAELVHRGVMCVMNLVCIEGPLAESARQKVTELGGFGTLKATALRFQQHQGIVECAVPALRALTGR